MGFYSKVEFKIDNKKIEFREFNDYYTHLFQEFDDDGEFKRNIMNPVKIWKRNLTTISPFPLDDIPKKIIFEFIKGDSKVFYLEDYGLSEDQIYELVDFFCYNGV